MAYRAPVDEMLFVMNELAGLPEIAALPAFAEATPDLVSAVLTEAGRLASGVLDPLNKVGDQEGSHLENGVVRTPTGWKEAWDQYRDGGWCTLPFDPDYGGQGLPWLVAIAVQEVTDSANMAFGLCPMLTKGTVELLAAHGSKEQKETYLPNLISGQWTGTMNLTEPQAGSDLSQVRAKAVKSADGSYRIFGQKIFITYGDHEMAENIVHFVLARLPDAPPGVKGISLFIVPKFLPKNDGAPGERNDARCVSLEHKLGIHASPTCVMSFGDHEGAVGFLVGEENRGLEYMFTMMNNARLAVGLEGVAIAERAYQHAVDYARQRVQSKPLGANAKPGATIIAHADVRRMLMDMRSRTEAARALAYYAAGAIDRAHHLNNEVERQEWQRVVDLMIPVVKGWCSETGIYVANQGVQVHGGMGFIEEAGAAQYLRDARITAIYEGTNGIQANDLVGRKVGRDKATAARTMIARMWATVSELEASKSQTCHILRDRLAEGLEALSAATDWVAETYAADPVATAAGSFAYLNLWGIVAGGWLLARGVLAAEAQKDGNPKFLHAKSVTARFFAEQYLTQAHALKTAAMAGKDAVMGLDEEDF
ncbi:putative acyl-CoA dehydrogenase [Rhodospirillaceae bacterium LM-1]|nr:putative acyl-CoA dehydrogenase [Rhodospirillaceae bacterium LM-1]